MSDLSSFRLRSYVPRDLELAALVQLLPQPSVEGSVRSVEARLSQVLSGGGEGEVDVRPRRPNWDLKREWGRAQAPLEVKYRKAMAELLRQEAKGSGELRVRDKASR